LWLSRGIFSGDVGFGKFIKRGIVVDELELIYHYDRDCHFIALRMPASHTVTTTEWNYRQFKKMLDMKD